MPKTQPKSSVFSGMFTAMAISAIFFWIPLIVFLYIKFH